MRFGAQVSCYRNTWDSIREVAEVLDAGPWESIWFADHYLPPPGRKEEEHLSAHEAFTVAAAVAGFTETLTIGHLVLGNTYRNPGLTAKMAGTVDHISHGRFVLGIGAAWFKREHEAYGWDFPVHEGAAGPFRGSDRLAAPALPRRACHPRGRLLRA